MSNKTRTLPLEGYKPTSTLPEGVSTVQVNPAIRCPFNQAHEIWQSNRHYTCPTCLIYWNR